MKRKITLSKAGLIAELVGSVSVILFIPFLAAVFAIIGIDCIRGNEGAMFYVMQLMVVLSLAGSLTAYRGHRKAAPLVLAILSAAAIIYGINAGLDTHYMYPGMIGMLAVSVWNSVETRRATDLGE